MVTTKYELRNYQKDCVESLSEPQKHIVYATMGCLAEDTPVLMADGSYKPVQGLAKGDRVLSYNEERGKWVENEVDITIRTCHKPKPMIQFEYDGEEITTTYDHPFFNGEGYYPLYQLIWGALETNQRARLKLLCKQYGQDFDNKAIWCKHCSSNEAVKGQEWLLQDYDGREDSQSSQSSSRELAGQPYQIAMCEPYQRGQGGQQSREFRVVYSKIQCLVGSSQRGYQSANITEKENFSKRNEGDKNLLYKTHGTFDQQREKSALREIKTKIPPISDVKNKSDCRWVCKVLEARPYYTISLRKAPYTYCIGEKHNFITHNSGKTAIALKWAEQTAKATGKTKLVVWTTASATRSGQWFNERDMWAPALTDMEVVSWHMAKKWASGKTTKELSEYIFIADEVQRSKQGVSSLMGRAFLLFTRWNKDWIGLSGTPGDKWIDFYPYFVAAGKVKNKTTFQETFCIMQRYPFPMILNYKNVELLEKMWKDLVVAPDTSRVMAELPPQTHQVVRLPAPKGYKKVMRTSKTLDGEMLESNMELLHYLRQMCNTKDKVVWLEDFLTSVNSPVVIFYNYTCERETILELAKKLKRKVWRVDGEKHEIPTADKIGERDIVLCHYLSGSEALNLQFINYWVSYSYNYSYSTTTQAFGRIRRLGQTKPQFYFQLRCDDTIEVEIAKILSNKRDFSADTWEPKRY